MQRRLFVACREGRDVTIQHGNYFCTGMSSVFLAFLLSLFLPSFCFKELAWDCREWGGERKIPFWQDTATCWIFPAASNIWGSACPHSIVSGRNSYHFLWTFFVVINTSSFFSSDNVVRFRGFITFVMHAKNYTDLCELLQLLLIWVYCVCISRFMV